MALLPAKFTGEVAAAIDAVDVPPQEPEAVNHPAHYTMGKIEVIDAIEDWKLGFHEGNVVKYVARAKHKGEKAGDPAKEIEDLKKARWYLDRAISKLEE